MAGGLSCGIHNSQYQLSAHLAVMTFRLKGNKKTARWSGK